MCHKPLLDANFYAFLLRIDDELAAELQAGGCHRCGSALHKNRYQRKPRDGGLIVLEEGSHFQLSLSCSKCNKRHPDLGAISGPSRLSGRDGDHGECCAFRSDWGVGGAAGRMSLCSREHGQTLAGLVAAGFCREFVLEDRLRAVHAAGRDRDPAGQHFGAVQRS
jgi:hypothetical protein